MKITKETIKEKSNDIKFRAQIKKEGIKTDLRKAIQFCAQNRELVAVCIPVVSIVTKGAVKLATDNHHERLEKRSRNYNETHIWDYSRGRWVETKRPLKKSEQIEFDRLRELGYSATKALDTMNLI